MIKHITKKDYEKAQAQAQKAADTVPDWKVRIRRETYENALIKALKEAPSRTPGKPHILLHRTSKNLGTKAYSYMIATVEDEYFTGDEKTTAKTTIFRASRSFRTIVKHEKALAIVKE